MSPPGARVPGPRPRHSHANRPSTDDHAEATPSPAEREALQRAHAVRVVLEAIESGAWPLEAETLDGTAAA